MTEIIISLTTIPSRIRHMKPCADSLAKQGLPVLLSIPKEVKRLGLVFDGMIPDFLKRKPFEVSVVEERGPITKLFPALERGHATIITADDDIIYGEGWAATLLKYADKYPNAALTYRGRNFDKSKRYNSTKIVAPTKRVAPVDFITGIWGALYHSRFFLPSIFEEYLQAFMNDDVTVSAHLKHRGVPMLAIPRSTRIIPYNIHKIDALWSHNRRKNDEYLRRLYW